MKPTARYRRRSDSITADLGGGRLAIMGMVKGGYYALNPVAHAIWDLLEQPRSTEEIRTHVCTRFEVDADACARDADHFLQELLDEGLALRA